MTGPWLRLKDGNERPVLVNMERVRMVYMRGEDTALHFDHAVEQLVVYETLDEIEAMLSDQDVGGLMREPVCSSPSGHRWRTGRDVAICTICGATRGRTPEIQNDLDNGARDPHNPDDFDKGGITSAEDDWPVGPPPFGPAPRGDPLVCPLCGAPDDAVVCDCPDCPGTAVRASQRALQYPGSSK